jgi:hypothetical protein
VFTAEAQSTLSLFFFLLSVERTESKKQSASGKFLTDKAACWNHFLR